MRLDTKCSIALHCLVFIAEYENKAKVTSELLAKSTGCNAAAIRSILSSLQKANIITIVRGVGGAHLAKDPKALTAWEVYHALEPNGLGHFIGIHPKPSQNCPVGRHIESVLSRPYEEVSSAVQRALDDIILQQLLDDYHENEDVKFDKEP